MITLNITSLVWRHPADCENDEYWTYRGKRYDTEDEAEYAMGAYEAAEEDHFDAVRRGEES